jgi:hypothetical protein
VVSIKEKFKTLGINLSDILLPTKSIDYKKWSVIACDQYTSEPDYWNNVKSSVGTYPSTLNMFLPEIYLESDNSNDMIKKINATMDTYLNDGIFKNIKDSLIYIERTTSKNKIRRGILLSVDLEMYDYKGDSCTMIRPTEGTIVDRLPPRVKIRENSALELPHIMMFLDDPENNIFSYIQNNITKFKELYNFKLMINEQNISGYQINDIDSLEVIYNEFSKLCSIDDYNKKYNLTCDEHLLLFATGDGNHSLATAKCHWENIKLNLSESQKNNHPARYSLVEVVNIHDESIEFEPIHRILFNVDTDKLLKDCVQYFNNKDSQTKRFVYNSQYEMNNSYTEMKTEKNIHLIKYVSQNECGILKITNPILNLEIAMLQDFIDSYIKNSLIKVDYIHGEDVINNLSKNPNTIGFLVPPISKNSFFKSIILDGSFPRKTFSMGEASDKRYYLECKKI